MVDGWLFLTSGPWGIVMPLLAHGPNERSIKLALLMAKPGANDQRSSKVCRERDEESTDDYDPRRQSNEPAPWPAPDYSRVAVEFHSVG